VLRVTAEHLGGTMSTNDPETGQYVPAGGSEWGATYTMPRDVLSLVNAEKDAYLSAVRAVNVGGWPDYPVATVRPGTVPAYFGEGSSLYAAGLGTVSLCPSPTYLLQAGDARQPQLLDLDKLDQRLMYSQILALAHAIGTLDALPASAL